MESLTKVQAFQQKNKKWKQFYLICLTVSAIYFILLKLNDFGLGLPYDIGNFNVPFSILTIGTGIIFLRYLFCWKKDPEAMEILQSNKPPFWIEWSYPLFIWLFAYVITRMFILEPYIIPSGSMEPTLQVKTAVFVDKNDKVILNPFNNKQIKQLAPIERGEVLVFKYPLDPRTVYIKRAVGIPGDLIEWNWKNETLSINEVPVTLKDIDDKTVEATMPRSNGKTISHLQSKRKPGAEIIMPPKEIWKIVNGKDDCLNTDEKLTCKIPEGKYFMMGDNRNESSDSRFWGLLPHDTIIGNAKYQLDLFNFKANKL